MSKLFIFDMDGTILNSKNEVQQATIEAIIEGGKKGHKFIIATGRPFKDAVRDIGELAKYLDYIVCNNGTYYAKADSSEFIYNAELPIDFFDKVIRVGKEYKCFFAIHGSNEAQRTYLGDKPLSEINWSSSEFNEFKKFKDEFVDVDYSVEWAKKQHISQMSLRSDKKTIAMLNDRFKKYLDKIEIHISNDVYLDINPKNVTKMSGINIVAKKMGYKTKDIIAFGDSGNDLQMLKGVGLGICMGNGNDVAKITADIVIGSNDTNAIGDKILEIIND